MLLRVEERGSMAVVNSVVYYPETIQDLLLTLNRTPHALLWAGGTGILKHDASHYIRLKEHVISLSKVQEMKLINRSERFLEFGACVSLEDIRALGEKLIPRCLLDSLQTLASPTIRNLATIGGNIATKEERKDLFPVLVCLDAYVELKKTQNSRWLSISQLFNAEGSCQIQVGEVLTRIRIPFETWDLSFVRKLSHGLDADDSYPVFCFLGRTSRNIVSDLRIAMTCGKTFIRSRELESALIGRTLPLSKKEASLFCDSYTSALNVRTDISPSTKKHFSLLLDWSLHHLTL